jgi:hypothetical protein
MGFYLVDDHYLLVDTAGQGEPVQDIAAYRTNQKINDSMMAESLTASTTATVQVFNRILLRDQEKLERLVALEKMKDPKYPERVLVVHNLQEIDTIEKLNQAILRDISIFTGF